MSVHSVSVRYLHWALTNRPAASLSLTSESLHLRHSNTKIPVHKNEIHPMELVLSNTSTQKCRSKPNSQHHHRGDKPSRTTEVQRCLPKHPTKQKAAPKHTNHYTRQLQHLSPLRRCSEGSDLLPPAAVRQFCPSASGQRLGAALTKPLPRSRSDGETARGTAPPGCDCTALSGPPAARLQRAASRGKEHPTRSSKKPLFSEMVPVCLSQYVHLQGL